MTDEEAALLAAIARDPEDVAPYLVYADWLQARADPRGELIALQAGTERSYDHRISDAELAHVHAHAAHYLGKLAPLARDPRFLALRWRYGFIAAARLDLWGVAQLRGHQRPPVRLPVRDVVREFLALPSARFLCELAIRPVHVPCSLVVEELDRLPATLRVLALGPDLELVHRWRWHRERDFTDAPLGDLSELWSRVPQLRSLVLIGNALALGRLELPTLRTATIAARDESIVRQIANARWPELEALELVYGSSPEGVATVLARDDLVTLGRFAITHCAFANQVCSELARSPLAPQLTEIALTSGTLDDEGVAILVAARGSFPSLARIDVSHSFVSRAGLARLAAIAPTVIAQHMRAGAPTMTPDRPNYDDFDDDIEGGGIDEADDDEHFDSTEE